jgi:hypothetical protein
MFAFLNVSRPFRTNCVFSLSLIFLYVDFNSPTFDLELRPLILVIFSRNLDGKEIQTQAPSTASEDGTDESSVANDEEVDDDNAGDDQVPVS